MKKKIGVIISCYNHVNYIEQAISSILNQTCKDFEIYAADDCSTDGTAEKLIQYDEQIKEIHLFDENQGGRGRFLLSRVENEYTALLNSDDFWYPKKLEKQLNYMEAHPECAACFTWCTQVDENNNPVEGINAFHEENRKKEEWMRYFFEYGNSFAHPSMLIRTKIYRELLEEICFAFRQIPDYHMWVKLLQKHEVYIIEEELMGFRWHSSEKTTNVSAATSQNIARHINEECYMWYKTIKDMDLEYFVKAFEDLLLIKNPLSKEMIQCEKFFVLARCREEFFRQAAIYYFYDIFNDRDVQECFKQYYNFSKKEFYEFETKIGYAKIFLDNEEKKKLMQEIGQSIISLNM